MPRYQNHIRNATSQALIRFSRRYIACRQLRLILGACLSLVMGILAHATFLQPFTIAVLAQEAADLTPNFYVTPAETTGVTLQSHVAEFRIDDEADGALSTTVRSTYRLHNPGDSLEVLGLRVSPGETSTSSQSNKVQSPIVTVGGQLLPLEDDGAGSYTTQVQLDADERLTLVLSYDLELDVGLPTIRYSPRVLNQWPGNVSLRVDMLVPQSVPPESWTRIEPNSWTYALADESTYTNLKWLYDSSIPDLTFVFQFVNPAIWAEILVGKLATEGGAEPGDYKYLGDLYQSLFVGTEANPAVRNRFYAQALAAYSAGLVDAAASTQPQDLAPLHIGLANLYRNRSVGEASISAVQHAEMMVLEAGRAISLLPEGDIRRRELMQWQADGLRVMLQAARNRKDWQRALSILDQLAQMPSDYVHGIAIDQERREVTIQQALQLMEQGNRDAAIAVAGPDISSPDLLPPEHSLSTFVSWHITATARPNTVEVTAIGVPAPDRYHRALQSARELEDVWQLGIDEPGYAFAVEETTLDEYSGESVIRVSLSVPVADGTMDVANLLPSQLDWALLRALLAQLAPSVQRRQGLLWQTVEMAQPLDLRSAGDQWEAMAANLERQADEFLAQSVGDGMAELPRAEEALQARIRAVRYRAAAQEWRALRAQQLALAFAQP